MTQSAETRNSCPDGDNDGNPDSNGGNEGTSDGSDGTSDGTSDGGSGISISEEENCNMPCTHPSHVPHTDPCQHPTCETTVVINIKSSQKVEKHMRNPCIDDLPEVCYTVEGDLCPDGCNVDGTCIVEEEEENDTIGVIPIDLHLVLPINTLLAPDFLTEDQIAWIFSSIENIAFAELALEILENGGEVDFDDVVIFQESFIDSDVECNHKNMLDEGEDTLYSKMFDTFNSSIEDVLVYRLANNPNNVNDLGFTIGDNNNNDLDYYTISITNNAVISSNLAQKVTLIHELIHAFLFDILHEAVVINFDQNGEPFLNPNHICGEIDYGGVNLTTISTAERYEALLCAMNQNGLLNGQNWSHEIFNNFTFDTSTYQEAIADFIFTTHDWDSEPAILVAQLQAELGANWKQKASEIISWSGLNNTLEFQNYLMENNYLNPEGTPNVLFNSLLSSLITIGNHDCIN